MKKFTPEMLAAYEKAKGKVKKVPPASAANTNINGINTYVPLKGTITKIDSLTISKNYKPYIITLRLDSGKETQIAVQKQIFDKQKMGDELQIGQRASLTVAPASAVYNSSYGNNFRQYFKRVQKTHPDLKYRYGEKSTFKVLSSPDQAPDQENISQNPEPTEPEPPGP